VETFGFFTSSFLDFHFYNVVKVTIIWKTLANFGYITYVKGEQIGSSCFFMKSRKFRPRIIFWGSVLRLATVLHTGYSFNGPLQKCTQLKRNLSGDARHCGALTQHTGPGLQKAYFVLSQDWHTNAVRSIL
jgi:hypothetical protein